jgi:CRISPR-associated endonuclease/helicase Cas3
MLEDEQRTMEEALMRAEQGQQVLWIENTVPEAQERYRQLAARCADMGVACGLMHSRFTAYDRQQIEELWVNLFGKLGWSKRVEQRRLLIGTQVLEQSLDIDADFLVSSFCPTDMLLQRFGRLWRHEKTPRHHTAKQEAWILAPQLEKAVEQPIQGFGPTAWVYSPYVLCRSLEVWQDLRKIDVPADIRTLIEATYISRKESGKLDQWRQELEHGSRYRRGRQALQQLARITLSQGGKTLPETKAQTRYSEEDPCEVLLLRSMVMKPESCLTQIVLLSGDEVQLPWNKEQLNKRGWRQLSAKLMSQMVSVRYHNAPLALSRNTLEKLRLQHCFYLGDPEWDEPLLRLALVDTTGYLQGYQRAPLNKEYVLQYRDDIGYSSQKKE